MADTKITGLTALTSPAVNDLFVVVDVSDTSMAATGTDKKMTVADALKYTVSTVTAASSSPSDTGGFVVILCDCTSNNIAINLPTAVGNTAVFRIKKTDSTANTVTITPAGAETIDGDTSQVISKQNTSVDLISNNAAWSIV